MGFIKSNPQLQEPLSMLQSSGMTPKEFFFQYAQQKGIDPNQFVDSLLQE